MSDKKRWYAVYATVYLGEYEASSPEAACDQGQARIDRDNDLRAMRDMTASLSADPLSPEGKEQS